MPRKLKLVIADDHDIIRDGLIQILSFQDDLSVIGEACDGESLLRILRTTSADVLLMDLSMPGKSGIALIQQVHAAYPDISILVLSMHQEAQYAVQAIRAGALGYVTKNTPAPQLIDAIRKVAVGNTVVPPGVADKLVRQLHEPKTDMPHMRLTPREFQVFQLLVEGHSIGDIAKTMFLSSKTVSTHKAHIHEKMEIPTMAGLVYYALQKGLLHAAP
ncbi:MAG: response regulator transcription factor [Betaproteobacteria bacterium]|nr:response regulator transcription factor [Betaproteobacteria bacterium]